MTTHITYATAKRIKEFLGDSAPNSIDGRAYILEKIYGTEGLMTFTPTSFETVPAYQLHDLLNTAFCEAMGKAYESGGKNQMFDPWNLAHELTNKYFKDGIPAVESALMEMMK